ncbi:hypothetical protein [Pseudomonas sp. YuFO8]|uniref:hypothetical protein n=1 Tax=Pseudomonas sp. YuFO8 TaxID=3095361 RepID=UPI002B248771|nr:hypothetical protein [Pseudomonas sp. YuFO8]MEB2621357.1 hypothetical protein [Pseudomonas sp. YuFO8]
MPIKGTIQVQLSQSQAAEASRWLVDDYAPVMPPYHMSHDWEDTQRQLAAQLGQILHKAAARKRSSTTLNLGIRSELVRWFASFTRDGGWYEFGERLPWRHAPKDELFPGQPAPDQIQAIAALFLHAASRRRGRPLLTLLDTVHQEERGAKAGADPRVLRRLHNQTKPEREWTKEETDAAGPEPES